MPSKSLIENLMLDAWITETLKIGLFIYDFFSFNREPFEGSPQKISSCTLRKHLLLGIFKES